MNDFATSLIGRTVIVHDRKFPIVAVVVARGGRAEGNLLIYYELNDGTIMRRVFDDVKLERPPATTLVTDEQKAKSGGYIPRKGQRVNWVVRNWDYDKDTEYTGVVTDFAAIDPKGSIILTVDVGKHGPRDLIAVRADQIKTWTEEMP